MSRLVFCQLAYKLNGPHSEVVFVECDHPTRHRWTLVFVEQVAGSLRQYRSVVDGGRLGYSQRHLTLGVAGGLLRQERLPLRGAPLLDEDGTATTEPDVEVVAVVGRQADPAMSVINQRRSFGRS